MPPFQEMEIEHEAWIEMVKRFRALGLEPNDEKLNPLIDQIRYWGETLVALRIADPQHVDTALREAKEISENGRPI